MRTFLILVTLAACGSDNKVPSDAAIDTPVDTPPPALDCTTYCNEIQTTCTVPNAQYGSADQCTKTCASFVVGTSKTTDTTGNTLGCRINHAFAAAMMPGNHCPQAGPAGDVIMAAATTGFCSGGNVCASFCTLELMACGSMEAPLQGNPTDRFGAPLYQFKNLADCMRLCPSWDEMHVYSTMAKGDSLACRLSAAVTASGKLDDAKLSCPDTADAPTGQCAGAASP